MYAVTVESDTLRKVANAHAASPLFATMPQLAVVDPLVSFTLVDASAPALAATSPSMLADEAVPSPCSSELHRLLLTSVTASSQLASLESSSLGDTPKVPAAAAQWDSVAADHLPDLQTAIADSELLTHLTEPPCSSPMSLEWLGSGAGSGVSGQGESAARAGLATPEVGPAATEAPPTSIPMVQLMEELLPATVQRAVIPPLAAPAPPAHSRLEELKLEMEVITVTPSHHSREWSPAKQLVPSTPSSPTTLAASPSAPVAAPAVHRPPASTPSRLASWIRSRVSQNKVRFRDGDFNLDLTYIAPRIIAMGYPAHGTEYYIRNPIDEVERFFDERHGGHFRIYNLCAERTYDSATRFHGCFRRIPFEDHNAPPLSHIKSFVRDAAAFLDADAANVVGVHCKAGKGRTGVMVSCLLLYMYPAKFATASAAVRHFDTQRTTDGAGLTIPSQRRYVQYFGQLLRECGGAMPYPSRRLGLHEVVIRVSRQGSVLHTSDLYFVISNHARVLLDSRLLFPRGPTIGADGCVFAFSSLRADAGVPMLEGDIKVAVFRRRPIVMAGKESTACYLWFNTSLCPSLNMAFPVDALDKVDVAAVGKSVVVSLSLVHVGVAKALPPPQHEISPGGGR